MKWLNPFPEKETTFYLGISLLFAALYGGLSLQEAFSGDYVVQDDARQHVFWMARFVDPDLFPQDLIADYFQSVSPLGYTWLYRIMAALGVEPIAFSKILPLVLGLAMTVYCYRLTLLLLPIPWAGMIAAILFNQNLWMQDSGLSSGTAKAFLFPLLPAFLYYLLRGAFWPCLATIALLGLFYPSFVLIAAGILVLRLWDWYHWPLRWTPDRQERWLCLAGLATAFLVLLPFALESSAYGPVITLEQARSMPEFAPSGRTSFFSEDFDQYWLNGTRSGVRLVSALMPPLTYAGLVFPLLLGLRRYLPLLQQTTRHLILIPQVLIVSFGLFFLAHGMLFKLYLPSRYTQHTLRLVIVLMAGMAIAAILRALFQSSPSLQSSPSHRKLLDLSKQGIGGLLVLALVAYPLTLNSFLAANYVTGKYPDLYRFFQEQPKDIVIASLDPEASNLPTFAKRSILASREYGITYHWGYYQQFRQRSIALINAQYSADPQVLKAVIDRYGVDFWVVHPKAFQANYLTEDKWIRQFQPATQEALETLAQGRSIALQGAIPECTRLTDQSLIVLDARCLQDYGESTPEKTRIKTSRSDTN